MAIGSPVFWIQWCRASHLGPGIGVSYNAVNLNVGVHKSGWNGEADLRYEGLYAHVSFYW